MVIPPPNVTGSLHMGHALNNTIQDVVGAALAHGRRTTRCGLPAPTTPASPRRTVVEQQARTPRDKSRHDLGREAFIERVLGVAPASTAAPIIEPAQGDWAVAATATTSASRWSRGYSGRRCAKVFVNWFNAGLIYRGLRIINWCPSCGTSLSDAEVEHEE